MAITKITALDRSRLAYPLARMAHWRIADFKVAWAEWQARRGYRKDLERLLRVGPYMIKDVGLTLEEAKREIEKPFWRV